MHLRLLEFCAINIFKTKNQQKKKKKTLAGLHRLEQPSLVLRLKMALCCLRTALKHIGGAPPQALYVDAVFTHQMFTEHSLGQASS